MRRRAFVRAAAVAAAAIACVAALAPAGAQAADAIHLIYPFAAGGAGDGMARLIADRIGTGLSKAAIVANQKTDAERWAPAVKASGFTPQP